MDDSVQEVKVIAQNATRTWAKAHDTIIRLCNEWIVSHDGRCQESEREASCLVTLNIDADLVSHKVAFRLPVSELHGVELQSSHVAGQEAFAPLADLGCARDHKFAVPHDIFCHIGITLVVLLPVLAALRFAFLRREQGGSSSQVEANTELLWLWTAHRQNCGIKALRPRTMLDAFSLLLQLEDHRGHGRAFLLSLLCDICCTGGRAKQDQEGSTHDGERHVQAKMMLD
mmetsp:Transcript_37951/g.69193  ORF Transcript_37951/g.69193 Transcript_37951/m.69193 type:complete len:229 (+) Transcript_37951:810-1496(+)